MPQAPSGRYTIDMCNGPVLPGLLRFSLPLTFSTMLQLLFNAADVIVVGRYAGDLSLAAVGSNTSLIALLTNLFLGLSIGASILAARYYGSGEEEELHKTVHTAMLLSVLCGLLLTVVGILGARTLLIWMKCPANVLELATLYLRIYFSGMIPSMIYNFGAAVLRAKGDTQRPLYYLSAAGIVNVGLNLLFVIVFHLDVAGVAIATVISQCISAVLMVGCLMRESGAIRLQPRQLRLYRDKLLRILQIGLPAGFQAMLFSLANVVIQSSVNSFGEVMMAGNSAASSFENFIYASINAHCQAGASFTSQNYGAGNYRRIKTITWQVQLSSFLIALLLCVLTCLFGPQLLGIYSKNPAVIQAGMIRMRIVCAVFALDSIMDVIAGSLRGIGYNVLPMVVTLLGACVFRLVWLSTVFQIPAYHRIETVYIVYPISWILTSCIHLLCFFFAYRRIVRQFKAKEAEVAAG